MSERAERQAALDPRPLIALTMGDPAGIGPEIVAATLADGTVTARCRPIVVGDPEVLRAAVALVGAPLEVVAVDATDDAPLEVVAVDATDDARVDSRRIEVLAAACVRDHAWGELSQDAGQAALACLTTAAGLAVDGIVSAPLNKQALRLAGMRHHDELELLAEITSSHEPVMVGVLPSLWTLSVTGHVPLRAVADLVSRERVLANVRRLAHALASTTPDPRIAVAGLNPHAGEGGDLGREEIDHIAPAIVDARAAGIDAIGPLAPDTAFPAAIDAGAAGVVCMYHDQANIARKLHDRRGQATLYLGLPMPVATTAHGTAFDRAGTGTASPASLRAALEAVVALAAT
jgi:4-hydroxythreonine-4-phosphate dehydrogenase